MEIRCRCTACQAKFKVAAKYAGKKARCPKCQQVVEVPLESLENTTTSLSALATGQPVTTSSTILPPMPAAPVAAPASGSNFAPATALTPSPILQPTPSPAPLAAEPSAADSFAGFQLQTKSKPTIKTSSINQPGTTSGKIRAKKSNSMPLLVGGGLLAVVLVVGGGAAIWALSKPASATVGGTGTAGGSAKGTSSTSGTLVFDWPEADRRNAQLSINGRRESFAASGELKFALAAGSHQVRIQRRGYEPFETDVTLGGGATEHVAPEWKAVANVAAPSAGFSPTSSTNSSSAFPIGTAVVTPTVRGFTGWLQSFDQAKQQAVSESKDILIVFGSSDRQPSTQQLAQSLEAGDVTAITGTMVRLVIDFPRTAAGRELVQDLAQNAALLEEFGIDRLPAVALSDARGKAYAIEREWEEGFSGLAATLTKLQEQKAKRDELMAAAQQGNDEPTLTAAATAVKWLHDQKLWRLYSSEIGAWLTAAQRLDAENQKALLEVFFEPHWMQKVIGIREDDAYAIVQATGELKPWTTRMFRDHDRGAKVHLVAAQLLASADKHDEALEQLSQAAKYQPKDSSLARAVTAAKSAVQNRDVIGTGSGYLVSSAGYVLTNRHVADSPGKIEIRLPESKDTVPATVVAMADDKDIALLKFTVPTGLQLPTLAIAPEPIGRGTPVAAFGYPLARELGSVVKLTDGLISALPDESNDLMYLLSVKINPGNSGGPLCDQHGDVAGMITAKTRTDFFGTEDSYGLAIPSADLVKFLDQHLPADAPREKPAAADAASLSWPQVDQKVNRGVLMVLIKRR